MEYANYITVPLTSTPKAVPRRRHLQHISSNRIEHILSPIKKVSRTPLKVRHLTHKIIHLQKCKALEYQRRQVRVSHVTNYVTSTFTIDGVKHTAL